jgi:hypothetical protein
MTAWLPVAIAGVSVLAEGRALGDGSDDEERDTAARASTNPLPYVETLKFEPMYTFSHGDTRYRAELQFEPALPYEGLLIPGLAIADIWSIARLQITAESLQNSQGTASGFENLSFVDVAAHRFGALTLGAGVATVFPMATSPALGPAKWQLGPAVAFNFAPVRVITIAALAQGLWSIAGSSDVADQSYVTLQPFITVHPYGSLIVISDAQMSFYWAGGSTTIPVDLGVGYAFTKHFVGTVKGQVTAAGSDDGTWKLIIQMTFVPGEPPK